MDHKRTGAALCSVGPGYDFKAQSATEFAPWAADNVFVPSFPYSPEAHIDDTLSSDYPSLSGGQPEWPNFTGSSQSPISAPFPFLSGDVLVSPIGWAMETDSDSCGFSPVDTCRPLPEVDATPNPGWSWSQPSSPSVEMESLPSPPATLAEYKTTTRAKAKPTPKLRTASRATRKSSRKSSRNSAASPSEMESIATDEHTTAEELRARRNHNLVEKQYRNRLNAQFERLLSVLPTDQRWSGKSGDEGNTGSEDKRMSKAEVLDCATRRIKELESERLRLQQERKELLKSMELMNGAIPITTTR